MTSRFPDAFVARVREVPITDALGGRVTLRRKGGSLWGCCPLHREKSPSFQIRSDLNRATCFGCGWSGDVIDLCMSLDGLGFRESIEHLAALAGLDLPTEHMSEEEREREELRRTCLRVMEEAATWWARNLTSGINGGSRTLRDRGLDIAAAKRWRLGWAPSEWDGLTSHLQRMGFHAADGIHAGVLIEKDGRIYDRFRGRLMFPIGDRRGRIIGAGGRLVEGEGAKYINTPESPIYKKSSTLYGLDRVVGARGLERVCVAEGYLDVITPAESGVTGFVAPCGTAITEGHFSELRRLGLPVVLVTDGDTAGQTAARKALPRALRAGVYPLVATLPPGLDPDDVVRQQGAAALVRLIGTARDLLGVVMEEAAARRHEGEAPLYEAAALLRDVDPVRRVHAARTLASAFRVDLRVVEYAIRGDQGAPAAPRAPEATSDASAPAAPSLDALERRTLALLCRLPPAQWAKGLEALGDTLSPAAAQAAALISRLPAEGPSVLDTDEATTARSILSAMETDPTPQAAVPSELRRSLAAMRLRSLEPLIGDSLDDTALLRLAVAQTERGHETARLRRML